LTCLGDVACSIKLDFLDENGRGDDLLDAVVELATEAERNWHRTCASKAIRYTTSGDKFSEPTYTIVCHDGMIVSPAKKIVRLEYGLFDSL